MHTWGWTDMVQEISINLNILKYVQKCSKTAKQGRKKGSPLLNSWPIQPQAEQSFLASHTLWHHSQPGREDIVGFTEDINLKMIQNERYLQYAEKTSPWRPWACAVQDTLIHQCKLVIHRIDRPWGKTPLGRETEGAWQLRWHQGKTKHRTNREEDTVESWGKIKKLMQTFCKNY